MEREKKVREREKKVREREMISQASQVVRVSKKKNLKKERNFASFLTDRRQKKTELLFRRQLPS